MNRLCVVVCTTLLAACAADVGPEDGLLDEDGSALVAKPDVVMNGIKHDDVVMNGLMFVPGNVQALRTWPLASETFRSGLGPPELTSLPCDTRTKKFMRYLIETALEPGQSVEFCGEKTEGAMGMHPKWNTNPATVEGQEAVTAGLMARTNAHGTPVMISPRGERPELAQFSISGPVPGDVVRFDPGAQADPEPPRRLLGGRERRRAQLRLVAGLHLRRDLYGRFPGRCRRRCLARLRRAAGLVRR